MGTGEKMDATGAIVVRALSGADFEQWVALRRALWPKHDSAELTREAAALAANASQEPVFVAETEDGALCGMVEVSIRDRAEGCETRNVGYIEGWYVRPGWRRQGIGRMLFAAAEEWARNRGCTEMGSDTDSDYPISPSAHVALGYHEVGHLMHFKKDLE